MGFFMQYILPMMFCMVIGGFLFWIFVVIMGGVAQALGVFVRAMQALLPQQQRPVQQAPPIYYTTPPQPLNGYTGEEQYARRE